MTLRHDHKCCQCGTTCGLAWDGKEKHWCPQCLLVEVERLRAELTEFLEDGFQQMAAKINEGDHAGWWDTCALTTCMEFGDRLVELGGWERHPDGYGRRWFYRPKAEEAKGGE